MSGKSLRRGRKPRVSEVEDGPYRMRWMAPAPPASNVPRCSCHRLRGKEPPNDNKDRRPRFGQGCFSSSLRLSDWTQDHQQEDQTREAARLLRDISAAVSKKSMMPFVSATQTYRFRYDLLVMPRQLVPQRRSVVSARRSKCILARPYI